MILHLEDVYVLGQQVLPFHAFLSWKSTDHEYGISILEYNG